MYYNFVKKNTFLKVVANHSVRYTSRNTRRYWYTNDRKNAKILRHNFIYPISEPFLNIDLYKYILYLA